MALAPSSEFERAERALLDAPEIELLGLMRRSSNYTFLARLCGPDEFQTLAVYKPQQGESPLWDFPDGSLYRREVAAYRLSRLLGWPDIPATVARDEAPHGVGALQIFIDAQPGRHYLQGNDRPPELWQRVALFDVLANNADRKSGHCLFDADGRVWVVDHGLTFHVEEKLRTVIWDFAGRPLPPDLRPDLERVLGELEPLAELLSRAELRRLRARFQALLEPDWRFPTPASGWSVPWPPV
jgi:uncharacterized repeat protein (TIGR03843 family)